MLTVVVVFVFAVGLVVVSGTTVMEVTISVLYVLNGDPKHS